MTIPPRSPSFSPESRAIVSSGRIPALNRIKSVSSKLPSANCMVKKLASSSWLSMICWVFLPVSTVTPKSSIFFFNNSPPAASSCTPISWGANSLHRWLNPVSLRLWRLQVRADHHPQPHHVGHVDCPQLLK